jgi:hypothetical protein
MHWYGITATVLMTYVIGHIVRVWFRSRPVNATAFKAKTVGGRRVSLSPRRSTPRSPSPNKMMRVGFEQYGLPQGLILQKFKELTSEGWAPIVPGLYEIWNDDPEKPGTVPTEMPFVRGPPSWFPRDGKVVGTIGCGHEYFSGAFDDMNAHSVHSIWSASNIRCNSWLDMVKAPETYIPLLEDFFKDICRTIAYQVEIAHPGAFGIKKGKYTPEEIATKIHFCACHAKSSLRRFHIHIASADDVSQIHITEAGSGQGDRHIKFQDLISFLKKVLEEKKQSD